ncbi:MAG: DUF1926 domain-containing protein [Candidatus Marinimicrobia bacterium]|nr:DUF1926 domain-containing protein [Candidatus Neomarinimicrobiota bacterium]
MLKSIRIIMAIHNHQPAGNFEHVFEDLADNAYMPLLYCLEKHSGINISLHYSGTLFSWLEKNRPDFIKLLKKLVRRGNIELLSGAFYEAILAGIPEQDRIGQITKYNQYLRHNFGYNAEGMWLAEKVWEADLPKAIEQANIHYTLIDEENFVLNGVANDKPVKGYYNTENEGHTVGIFPISRQCSNMMQHDSPEDMVNHLLENCSDNDQDMVLIAADGEKYRLDKEKYPDLKYNPWLDKFFTLIEKHNDKLPTSTLRDYWKTVPPQGIAYFSSGSYNDMQSWSLHNEQQNIFNEINELLAKLPDPEKYRPYVRGGVWRNFMTKYVESNWMQKRVQHISRKYKLLESQVSNKNSLRHIRDILWLAMGNDVYWHGYFGGIYLPHLRDAAWKNIISAEKQIEDRLYNLKDGEFVHNEADFDRDGHVEIQLSTKKYSAIFSKKYSGALVEFDYKKSDYNLFNTIRRYPESYHGQMDDKWQKQLVIDRKPRYGLLERFFDGEVTVAGLHSEAYEEASDFVNESVDVCHNNCDQNIIFERKGWINWQRAKVKKNLLMGSNGFDVDYQLSNMGVGSNNFSFGPEFNFSLHSGEDKEKKIFASVDTGSATHKDFLELDGVTEFGFFNHTQKVKIILRFNQPVRLLQYPVETIIRTQQGIEKIYQNTCVLPLWNINLDPGKSINLGMKFILEEI